MQKFTRALTREIEVAGERLAITFNETGISIRPVGSRKPPFELGWSAVLCALAGRNPTAPPGDGEVRAALEAIRGDSSVRSLVSAGDIDIVLSRLEDWLQQHRKRYHRGLRPGADKDDIGMLSKAFGKEIPEDLAALLRWHDGQNEDFIGAFVGSFNFMSVEEIINALDEYRSHKGWVKTFLPILDDSQENLVVLDTSTGAVREVWRGRTDHPQVAASLVVWLESLLAAFEAGLYHEDTERGDYIRAGEQS